MDDFLLCPRLAQAHGFGQEIRINIDRCAHELCLQLLTSYAPHVHLSIAATALIEIAPLHESFPMTTSFTWQHASPASQRMAADRFQALQEALARRRTHGLL